MGSTVSAAFASDNAAGAHPRVIAAIVGANQGPVGSYGTDPSTERAAQALREAFEAPDADVLFALTGTAANIMRWPPQCSRGRRFCAAMSRMRCSMKPAGPCACPARS